jgi:hypothetical protein
MYIGLDVDNSVMAHDHLHDLDAVARELVELEREEQALSAARRRLHDQIDQGFANELTLRRERQISDQRLAVHARIDELRALLRPLSRQPD